MNARRSVNGHFEFASAFECLKDCEICHFEIASECPEEREIISLKEVLRETQIALTTANAKRDRLISLRLIVIYKTD